MKLTQWPATYDILAKRLPLALAGMALLFAAMVSPLAAQPAGGNGPIRLDFPTESPGIPAYARLELLIPEFDVPENGDWAAIVFYRNPDCLPADFDLGQFFHFPGPAGPGAFGCELLIEGFELWANGPQQDMGPIYVRTRNAVPNLPIWFVSWPELSALLTNGEIFIEQIEDLPSLIRGQAWWFEEALYPNGVAPDPGISMTARGRLETGGKFFLDWHYNASSGEDEVIIALDLPGVKPPRGGPPSPICIARPDLPPCQ